MYDVERCYENNIHNRYLRVLCSNEEFISKMFLKMSMYKFAAPKTD